MCKGPTYLQRLPSLRKVAGGWGSEGRGLERGVGVRGASEGRERGCVHEEGAVPLTAPQIT